MGELKVTIQRIAPFAKALAMSKIVTGGFKNGTPLQISNEKVNVQSGADQYFGVTALTELHFRVKGIVYVLNDCLLNVSQERNIVKQGLQGKDGTVKEYISEGDYSISAEIGIGGDNLVSSNGQYNVSDAYPVTDVKRFIDRVLKPKESLEVCSDWLDMWGIRNVVIVSNGAAQETYSNRQTITVQMLSDEPYEIKLLKNA